MIIRISVFEVKKNQQTRGWNIGKNGNRKRERNSLTQRVVTVKVLNHIPTERNYQ